MFVAGKPKIGTSWFALLMALKVAAGQTFLGYPTEGGEVLYLALTDNERRVQDRARILGANQLPGMERLHHRIDWSTLDRGGLDEFEEWIRDHSSTKLIVIDTFEAIRSNMAGKGIEEDAFLSGLQQLAIESGIGLILIHHLCKEAADDWREQLCGSKAVKAAAHALLGLYRKRGQMDATLRLFSKDAPQFDLALRFNGGLWESMGTPPSTGNQRSEHH
jgi:RecA-family ATPase